MITTKICKKCKLPKDREKDFNFKNKARGIKHNVCKSCTGSYSEQYYEANQKELSERAKINQRNKRKEQKQTIKQPSD